MKIREIRAVGLRGATPEGGWAEELEQEDCVHTLVAVITDEGPVGLGSVYTSDDLVRAALALLEPLYRGENALEPERVSEKLHQNTFWTGRAARSPTPSAASTSPCGTCWERPPGSPSGGYWADATATASSPTPRS